MRKSAVLTLLLTGLLTLGATAARGQGGACPTGAQYVNPNNPSGPLVTLASFGVTSCFYIAASGSDSNSGTSETAPWLHAPQMPAATGNPAALTAVAGEGFIFRGGDTWHYFSGTPLVGLPAGWPTGANGFAWNWTRSGTSSNWIYIGVDPTWFTGSAWARPIFTNDNPIFTPSAPNPAVPSTTGVSSCAFPQGNLDDVVFRGPTFFVFDNFEFTGMCWNDRASNGSSGANDHDFIQEFAGGGGTVLGPRMFSRLYTHGWSHTPFTPANCASNTNPQVCNGPGTFNGSTQATNGGAIFAYLVCDGSDSDDLAWSCLANDAYDVEESVFRHFGGTQIFDNCHVAHDNLFEFANNGNDGSTHTDLYFCVSEYPANNFFYNNVTRFVATEYNQTGGLSAVFWWGGAGGSFGPFTDYVFNNVWHDENCPGNCNQWSFGGATATTQYNMYNNTVESVDGFTEFKNNCGGSQGLVPGGCTVNLGITSQNNHFITDNASSTPCLKVFSNAGSGTGLNGGNTSCSGDVFQTHSAANAQGYTSANDFRPTSGAGATAGAGANESGLVSSFGPAFASTTTNGCAYVTSNHTVSCPQLTPLVRPTTGGGPWNAGAFGFVSSTVTLTPTAHAFATTAVGNNSSDSPVTFALTNNTGVTITAVTISLTGANSGDFADTTSCATTLASGASCQIFVTFTPTALGSRTAMLSVSDSDASSPQTSTLSGTAIPTMINPSPANPVTFGVVVTDPSIPSTVKNEKHSEIRGFQSPAYRNLEEAPAFRTGRVRRDREIRSSYNFGHVVLAGFLHQDGAGNTSRASASQ
ncbi:MAG TPA: choice-of-anchor D domain-containing protein [Candidatus Acidoferrales bacterium]|nr:choice-of-anchor D domain-containing protein [Candidatus Acidoferrales bacterium]